MFIIIPGASVAVSNHDDENHSEKGEERTQKLLESIAQVSDMASQQSGFVYDSTSGLYYDVQTDMDGIHPWRWFKSDVELWGISIVTTIGHSYYAPAVVRVVLHNTRLYRIHV